MVLRPSADQGRAEQRAARVDGRQAPASSPPRSARSVLLLAPPAAAPSTIDHREMRTSATSGRRHLDEAFNRPANRRAQDRGVDANELVAGALAASLGIQTRLRSRTDDGRLNAHLVQARAGRGTRGALARTTSGRVGPWSPRVSGRRGAAMRPQLIRLIRSARLRARPPSGPRTSRGAGSRSRNVVAMRAFTWAARSEWPPRREEVGGGPQTSATLEHLDARSPRSRSSTGPRGATCASASPTGTVGAGSACRSDLAARGQRQRVAAPRSAAGTMCSGSRCAERDPLSSSTVGRAARRGGRGRRRAACRRARPRGSPRRPRAPSGARRAPPRSRRARSRRPRIFTW